MSGKRLLSGVKVLDLTHCIAGPFCTKLMAGLGAEVLKVEPPWGEPARTFGPFPGDKPAPEKSGLYLYLNTNKKGITLNLKTETGVKIFKDLVKDVDMVVENFEPRVMAGLGLEYKALAERNPALVLTSISNYGQSGPYRDFKGYNINALAMGGLMYVTGQPDREPLKTGGSQAEYIGGETGFLASLTAYFYRQATGTGQHVDVSIMEAIVSTLEYKLEMYSYQGFIAGRWCSRHPFSYPHGDIYPCKDGYVAVPPLPELETFSTWLEQPELADPKFANLKGRIDNLEQFEAALKEALGRKTREEYFSDGQDWRLGTGYVADAADLTRDAHLWERGFLSKVPHPEAGGITTPGFPFRIDGDPLPLTRAPLLGEHNLEVYGKLGFSREEMTRLRQNNVI